MSKVNIVIADKDEMYLEHLAKYFMEKGENCDISTFSSKASMVKYLESGIPADVFLLDQEMICDELSQYPKAVKILLAVGNEQVEGYESIRKYQKSEDILKKTLLKFAEATGNLDAVKGQRKTKAVAFYSPVGGSGKTTIALHTAAACVAAGLKTFYLNLEKIDSVSSLLGRTPGTMSDVFLSLKAKGSDVGVRVLSARGEEPNTGIHYISAPDSISEYSEVTAPELEKLIRTIISLNEYDVLVIDFSSEFYQEKVQLLENCDVIFVPLVEDEFSVNRVRTMFHEDALHQRYHSIYKKMKMIVNKADVSGIKPIIQNSGILNYCPLAGVITMSPVFMNQQSLFHSAEIVRPVFMPLIAHIQER